MIRIDVTLDDPLANVALDEAMLEYAEGADTDGERRSPEVLRLWEPTSPMVVLGRSSPFATEVNHEYCRTHGIPIVRRCSGGQSVVTGPGCLMYAVLLDYRKRPELRMLDVAHRFVMETMQQALSNIDLETQINGTSDLTMNGQKVSGNSLRCKRNWMVYHGTMICDLDIELIANCLGKPARQPEYRSNRSHRDFLTQLDTSVSALRESIALAWSATTGAYELPIELTRSLLQDKYRLSEWNEKL